MMPFKRNIENQLNRWKLSAARKPLIIRGARQVGKTTLIRDFAGTYAHALFSTWRNQLTVIILMILMMFKPFLKHYF
jgi:predicted AAA+ superfamily ATPase